MKKKFLSVVLTLSLLLSVTTPISASEITTEGDHSVSVSLTVEAPRFRVAIPTVLPINSTNYGEIEVADDVSITNNSAGPVRISNIVIKGINGWSTIDYASFNLSKSFVGEKNVGLTLSVSSSSVSTIGPNMSDLFDPVILTKGEILPLTYDAKLSAQKDVQSNIEITEVIFTVGWNY